MLLVIDIGNSNIVMGTYEGKKLMKHWRISTDRQKTGDEYGMLINDLFRYQGVHISDIHNIIISSVRALFPHPSVAGRAGDQDGDSSEL